MELNICHEKSTLQSAFTSMFKSRKIKYCPVHECMAYSLSGSDEALLYVIEEIWQEHAAVSTRQGNIQIRAPRFIKAKETEATSNLFQPRP